MSFEFTLGIDLHLPGFGIRYDSLVYGYGNSDGVADSLLHEGVFVLFRHGSGHNVCSEDLGRRLNHKSFALLELDIGFRHECNSLDRL